MAELGSEFQALAMRDWINILILIATIAAIIYGPIKAVKITRELDAKRERRARKLDVFRALMRTRSMRLDREHVTALNLVEVEFFDHEKIIEAHRAYVRHLCLPAPEQKDLRANHFGDREDLLHDLLQTMARELSYSFDKRELKRFAYAPVGWENDEVLVRRNAFLLSQLLEGKRPLTVTPFVQSETPYPPVPTEDSSKSPAAKPAVK